VVLSRGALYRFDPRRVRGRFIALAGAGSDAISVQNIRDAFAKERKLPPVKLLILPDGRLYVDDGRHRLLVAIEQGREVLAKFRRTHAEAGIGTVPLIPF
jgi:hypothetical protein